MAPDSTRATSPSARVEASEGERRAVADVDLHPATLRRPARCLRQRGKGRFSQVRVLYGVNGEGLGHATRSEVVDRRAAGERARRARHGLGRRVPIPRRPARRRQRDLRAVVRDGGRRDPPLGDGHPHDDADAPRAAGQRADVDGRSTSGGPRSWSPTSSRSPGIYARSSRTPLVCVDNIHMIDRCHHDEAIVERRARGLPHRPRGDPRDGPDRGRLRHHDVLPAAAAARPDDARAADRAPGDRRRASRRAATTSSSTRAAATELIEVLREAACPAASTGCATAREVGTTDGAIEYCAALGRRLPRGPRAPRAA